MSDFYSKMFNLNGGTTYTIFGAAGVGASSGETLETCVGLVSDISQTVSLSFAGGTGWLTGITMNAGVVYPYRPIGVRAANRIRGLA
jgi:hypothetical protein